MNAAVTFGLGIVECVPLRSYNHSNSTLLIPLRRRQHLVQIDSPEHFHALTTSSSLAIHARGLRVLCHRTI